MADSLPRVRAEDIEAALAQVAEIKAARVVVDEAGIILEIHVLALPTKQPKQLVRDIESTLMASFGIPVDHRKISIAQLGRDMVDALESSNGHNGHGNGQGATPVQAEVRPRIVSINSAVAGLTATSTVTLEIGGIEYAGLATGPASQTGRTRLMAKAALDALGQYTSDAAAFALEDVTIVQLGRERVAVACVSLVTRDGEKTYTGSALVRQNDSDSIVRATLDAVNRRVGSAPTE